MTADRKYARWTIRQIRQLQECFATMSREDLEREFAPHPWSSICKTAFQNGARRHRGRKYLAICSAHKPTFDFGRTAFK